MVRTDGQAYGHVITKFSRMGRLPYFLTHGATLRAPSCARAPLQNPYENHRHHKFLTGAMWTSLLKTWYSCRKKWHFVVNDMIKHCINSGTGCGHDVSEKTKMTPQPQYFLFYLVNHTRSVAYIPNLKQVFFWPQAVSVHLVGLVLLRLNNPSFLDKLTWKLKS